MDSTLDIHHFITCSQCVHLREKNSHNTDLEDLVVEDDTSDEEYNTSRDRVRECNRKLYDLSQ